MAEQRGQLGLVNNMVNPPLPIVSKVQANPAPPEAPVSVDPPVVEEPTTPTAAQVFPHLDEAQTAVAQTLLDAANIPATDYVTHDAKWVELTASLPDSPSRNSADQNAFQTELWKTLEDRGHWVLFYDTQEKVDQIKQSWDDYLSWLRGAPTYEYNGVVPGWGWSGYINGFQSWRGWILNFVPNKYGHLL